MKLLLDFSQTVIAASAANAKDIREGEPKELIKHIALNQILGLRMRFKGDLIVCCDNKSTGYWRKTEYPSYKGHRIHKKKDDDFLDWGLIHETIDELKVELRDNFPYTVLDVEGAEADDIIAALCAYFDENELVKCGLVEEPQDIVICSTDGDFQQLQKYRNVKQWNNVEKKFITCDNPKKFLVGHICTGDDGDNIPNICTGDWWSKARADNEKTRAKGFKQARLVDFYNRGQDACLNEEELRNFKRNEKLIDLDLIPPNVRMKIVNTYMDSEVKGTRMKVFQYLNKHRMQLLLANYHSF